VTSLGYSFADEVHHLPAQTYLQIPEMTLAPFRLGLTATYERADDRQTLLEDRMGPVVYEEAVDELAGEFLSEYETIQMSVELTADERAEYDDGSTRSTATTLTVMTLTSGKQTATRNSLSALPTTHKAAGR